MQTSSPYLLGFDFGMKYIGLSVGQRITRTATPLSTLKAVDGIPDWKEVTAVLETWRPEQLVIGLPLNMDGSEQSITFCARRFANRLHARYHLPVAWVDERLTTWEAKQRLGAASFHPAKYPEKKALNKLNATAAAVLLEQWIKEELLVRSPF